MLNDASITNALNRTVETIREGNLQQAQAGLAVLEFHRLMHPLKDDPARPFGPERVRETGDHIARCIADLALAAG